MTLTTNSALCSDIWAGEAIRPDVREKLLEIAGEFIISLGVEGFEEHDVVVTGSLANYNYTPESDVDLHVMYDPKLQNHSMDVLSELFTAKKTLWNEEHKIEIKGHPVELYAQSTDEVHSSTGVYSLVSDEWLVKPSPSDISHVDTAAVATKTEDLERQIDAASGSLETLTAIKDNIKQMRQSGLHANGEFSVENLTFKELRRSGYLEKLFTELRQLRDRGLSLESVGSASLLGPFWRAEGSGNGSMTDALPGGIYFFPRRETAELWSRGRGTVFSAYLRPGLVRPVSCREGELTRGEVNGQPPDTIIRHFPYPDEERVAEVIVFSPSQIVRAPNTGSVGGPTGGLL